MPKYPKWKVNVAVQSFYTVEVDAECDKEAVTKAVREVQGNPEYYLTANANIITGVFINDREARQFSPYVPEMLPSNQNLPE